MKTKRLFYIIQVMVIINILMHCSTLQDLANIQKPHVSLDKLRITDLSFDDISLKFDIAIDNPNSLSVKLAGFDYDFILNDKSFVQGEQQDQVLIQGQSKSIVEIPVTLRYSNIYSNYKNLGKSDSTDYQFNVGLLFDLPVLGETKIPVTSKGKFPLLKLPSLKIESLKLDKLNLTNANLSLNLRLDNPNSIDLLLNKIDYTFTVNGIDWISGLKEKSQKVNKNSNSTMVIPIQLNFIQIGQTVYGLLSGNNDINYNLTGFVNIGGTNSLLKNGDITFDQSGVMQITK